MTGAVIFSEANNGQARAQIIREKLELLLRHPFDLVNITELQVFSGEGIDYIAIEWELRSEFVRWHQKRHLQFGVAFYNDSFFSDIDDTTELDQKNNEALANGKWDVCKGINEFYILSDLLRNRTALKGYPSKLQIETTDLCNAKCIMCSHAYSRGTGIDIFKSGVLERIQKILPYLKVVVLHGNGEPFLKKDICRYLDILSSYNIQFITNTNLSILTDDIIKRLKKSFIELNVSCDAHTKELYESIRCGLNFDQFVMNAKRVRRECPGLTMKMSVVVMRQNLNYLGEITSFAADLGFDEVLFNQLCVDAKNDNLMDSPYLYRDLYVKALQEAIDMAAQRRIVIHAPRIELHTDKTIASNDKIEDKKMIQFEGICDWLVESPYISLQGNIAICCMNQNLNMGNLFERPFSVIWNNRRYQRFRADYYNGILPSCCEGCDFLIQNRLHYMTATVDMYEYLGKSERK